MDSYHIVSDTSCFIALEKLNKLHLLHNLFGEIYTTEQVILEYGKDLPEWISVKLPSNITRQLELEKVLDSGEASAITLALELKNAILIIDEKKGRAIAEQLHIKIVGTLQVLLLAKNSGLINNLSDVISELELKNFRISKGVKEKILSEAGELIM